jgi:hypothetical protein
MFNKENPKSGLSTLSKVEGYFEKVGEHKSEARRKKLCRVSEVA